MEGTMMNRNTIQNITQQTPNTNVEFDYIDENRKFRYAKYLNLKVIQETETGYINVKDFCNKYNKRLDLYKNSKSYKKRYQSC
jgi:hypothetical protein